MWRREPVTVPGQYRLRNCATGAEGIVELGVGEELPPNIERSSEPLPSEETPAAPPAADPE